MSTWATLHRRPLNLDGRSADRWHEWALDLRDILRETKRADRPLSVKELQAGITMSNKSINKRLDDLIVNGDVRRREDGPDGRVSYYEPAGVVHACVDGIWQPKPVRLP